LNAFEKNVGWELLFDGKSTKGWRNFGKETIGSSWKVSNGVLYLNSSKKPDGGWQAADGGDIITEQEYENFEFSYDWKISNCGNSGIMYNVVESSEYQYPYQTGPEMQILDDVCHPDTKYPTHRAGDLYDMIETKYVTVNPAGEWNTAKIISNNGQVEFWLNGYKVVDFEMHNDAWNEMVKNSKFKDMPAFGKARKGHIALQDHGDPIFFKNLKIRRLDPVN
jgi:cytochrome c